jgi:hypothetical protein
MYDDATLLPPLPLIHSRLTRNAKERHRLRTLLRLAIEARDDAERTAAQAAPEPRPQAAGREVDHAS